MLIELLMVIAIICLAEKTKTKKNKKTKKKKKTCIQADLSTLGSAVEVHYAKHGSYPAAIGDLVNATGKDGFLKSEPKPPIDGEAYSLNAATAEVTYVFKGTTYSSFGKNTKKG